MAFCFVLAFPTRLTRLPPGCGGGEDEKNPALASVHICDWRFSDCAGESRRRRVARKGTGVGACAPESNARQSGFGTGRQAFIRAILLKLSWQAGRGAGTSSESPLRPTPSRNSGRTGVADQKRQPEERNALLEPFAGKAEMAISELLEVA